MILLRLALASLLARRITVGLTIVAIALSVGLILGVEKVRHGARASFADTISNTDLIVGARSGQCSASALLGLPHRQRHQQHHLADLSGPRG